MSVPGYIVEETVRFAIQGYCKERELPMIPGKLVSEKPSWLPPIKRLVENDDRGELTRLATITAQSNQTSIDNIARVFGASISHQELKDAFRKVALESDKNKPSVAEAVVKFATEETKRYT